MTDNKKLSIRNSTAEFLIFTKQVGENGVEVMVKDENVWLTQKMMAELYEVEIPAISKHIKNIYSDGELDEPATISKMETVQNEGARQVRRKVDFFCLEMIIAVGYRVNSDRAIAFRQWATGVLKDFTVKGYVLDKKRFENGAFFGEDYFERLLEDIREIRLSERRFYQKITDIYATSFDYNPDSETTKNFYATVQNKLHFATHGRTAAELIMDRADAEKEHMGLSTWEKSPHGKIRKSDVSVAKNYLNKDELGELERIVSAYIEVAELQTRRRIPMSMEDWAKRLDIFLKMSDFDILNDSGKVAAEIAKAFAESEFEKYRIVQDRLYESDFDRLVGRLPKP